MGKVSADSAAAHGQDDLQMLILLLEVHQRPKPALHAVTGRSRVRPLVTELHGGNGVSGGSAPLV